MDAAQPLPQLQQQQQAYEDFMSLCLQDIDEMILAMPASPASLQQPGPTAKLATSHDYSLLPLLPPLQPGIPPQQVPDSTAAAVDWTSQQGYQQDWPSPPGHHSLQVMEGVQENALDLENVTVFLPVTQVSQGMLEESQGMLQEQGSPGVAVALHEPQGVPQPLQESQGVSVVLQKSREVPLISHRVPHVLQESQGVPSAGLGVQQVPQLTQTVSLEGQVSQECFPVQAEGGQRAGRRAAGPRRGRRAQQPRTPRLYERTEEFADPLMEKRRRDAINSKKNREAKKAGLQAMRLRVQEAIALRDTLRREVEELRQRETQIKALLRALPPAMPGTDTLPSTDTLPGTTTTTTLPGPTTTTTLPGPTSTTLMPCTTTTLLQCTTTTTPLPGTTTTLLPCTNTTPLPRTTSTLLPCTNTTPLPGTTSTLLPGTTSTLLPCTNTTPLPGTTSTPLPGTTTTLLPCTTTTPLPGTTSTVTDTTTISTAALHPLTHSLSATPPNVPLFTPAPYSDS